MRLRTAGFSLTELAIVLMVVGLLLGSVLSTVTSQFDLRNIRDTQSKLDEIKQALTGFAQANGRLPCPANGRLATGEAGAGLEEVDSTITYVCKSGIKYAVLPWATLGVSETDIWGRRFTYKVVQPVFSDAIAQNTWNWDGPTPPAQSPNCTAPVPTPTQSSFALCSLGSFTITTRTANNKTGSSVSNVPVVIISHGKNGYGAYSSSGGDPYGAPPAGVDEPANATATSTTFYSREHSPQASTCSDTAAGDFCEFDDLLAYIPVSLLVTRMVSAGKLP